MVHPTCCEFKLEPVVWQVDKLFDYECPLSMTHKGKFRLAPDRCLLPLSGYTHTDVAQEYTIIEEKIRPEDQWIDPALVEKL